MLIFWPFLMNSDIYKSLLKKRLTANSSYSKRRRLYDEMLHEMAIFIAGQLVYLPPFMRY